jgi:sortase (surface protein transpeptidase)
VLDPTAETRLTLITCHPFYFVGSAPDRYVVQARLEPDADAVVAAPARERPDRS